ncbi:hypothetical protein ABB07_36820 [Streptomyces incarnatus]|uniref:Secreted protein n=1 Tax=Streptomyces incarnatus TaxID=665007 RepID=A0ABM5TWD5_9ACTN|nr:hypothetical protein [Streptomyces incarnatus]AKJ15431.1 hypothetical protein ABB07_36820 [Streptomyces incarnatus]
MKVPRSTVVTAGLAAAAALAATGITYASAAPAPTLQSAPATVAAAPLGGEGGQGKGNEGREGREGDWGRILINERSYSAHPGDCITVVSGLGARSFNIRNETRKTVEVFRGAVCDNGAPIATVGPHSSSEGVRPCPTDDIHVRHGVVASFRVVRHHGGGDWD